MPHFVRMHHNLQIPKDHYVYNSTFHLYTSHTHHCSAGPSHTWTWWIFVTCVDCNRWLLLLQTINHKYFVNYFVTIRNSNS